MTPEQTVLAQAWADVFADGVATTMVLDEAWAYANTLPREDRAGAAALLVWVMNKRTQLRRHATRERARKGSR